MHRHNSTLLNRGHRNFHQNGSDLRFRGRTISHGPAAHGPHKRSIGGLSQLFCFCQNILIRIYFIETDRVSHFYKCRILNVHLMTFAFTRYTENIYSCACKSLEDVWFVLFDLLVKVVEWTSQRVECLSDGYILHGSLDFYTSRAVVTMITIQDLT